MSDSNTKIVREQGGEAMTVKDGGDINVESGGDVNLASGADLNVASGGHVVVDGEDVTDEMKALSGMTADGTDLNKADGVTAGTVTASKFVQVDSNKDIAGFRNHGAKTYTAGADGDAGTMEYFPATANKGKTTHTMADNAGDTTTNINVAQQAGARTYTLPDAGGDADYVMTEGNQTIDGIKTFEDALRSSANTVTLGAGVTAVHEGDGVHMRSTFTLTSFAVGTSGDNVALAIGANFATLPAGVEVINCSRMSVGLTIDDVNTAQTPELGIGNVVGSGANATLGDVGAGAENIIAGSAVADCAGTPEVVNALPTANVPLIINSGDPHALYLNAAATWADMSAGKAITANGTIVIDWVKVA